MGFVCSFPTPSGENMILNYIIYSKAFRSIIYVIINAGCLARCLTSWCILTGSPSSREMYFHTSAKLVSFKVLQFLMVDFPGSFQDITISELSFPPVDKVKHANLPKRKISIPAVFQSHIHYKQVFKAALTGKSLLCEMLSI